MSEPEVPDRECPYCKEIIKGTAIKCRYCHSTIEPSWGGEIVIRDEALKQVFETYHVPVSVWPSEHTLWHGPVGLFYDDLLIVSTRRVLFTHRRVNPDDHAWTALQLRDIDSVQVTHSRDSPPALSVTVGGGTPHKIEFRQEAEAHLVAYLIINNWTP